MERDKRGLDDRENSRMRGRREIWSLGERERFEKEKEKKKKKKSNGALWC